MRRRPNRTIGIGTTVAAGWLATAAVAQQPAPIAPPPGPIVYEEHVGPIRHVGRVIHKKLIGRPEEFLEPPLGSSVGRAIAVQRARADVHRFLVYRSDFYDGTDRLTTAGAARVALMAARLPGWSGPILVEWVPDRPDLADARRVAVTARLQELGMPVVPEQVAVALSPYPGMAGFEAANNYNILNFRSQAAPASYSLTPQQNIGTNDQGGP